MPHSRTRAAAHDRANRRTALDALLARAQHGRLTPTEGALLADYVRTELVNADTVRRNLAGTARALDRARKGADDTIRALETEVAEWRHRAARTWGDVWTALGLHYGLTAEQAGTEARKRRTADERRALAVAERIKREAEEARAAAERDAQRYQAAWHNARIRATKNARHARFLTSSRTHWRRRALDRADRIATMTEQHEQHRTAILNALHLAPGIPWDVIPDHIRDTDEYARRAVFLASRVRAECDRIEAEVHGQHDEDDDGKREAIRRIRAVVDALPKAPAPTDQPADGAPWQCPECGDTRRQHPGCRNGTPVDSDALAPLVYAAQSHAWSNDVRLREDVRRWEEIAESARDHYRHAARYLLDRLHITPREDRP